MSTAPALIGMAETAKARMQAKLQILHQIELYQGAHDYSYTVAAYRYVERYNSGELAVDQSLRELFPTLSHRTVGKWRQIRERRGVTALAGNYGNRRGQNSIDGDEAMREHVLACLVQYPHIRATRVMEFLRARFREQPDVELPSERTLRRWISAWKRTNQQTYVAVCNPDQWKNKYKAAFGDASEHIVRLNQLWELDATPADVMLTDGRYVLAGGIDVYSRRGTLLVTRSARGQANGELMRRKILAEGKPEAVKTDQGKDYIGHEFTTVLSALEIEQAVSNKFSPWEKPHIERFFRTFSHDLVELLPSYIGHDVADAQELRAQRSFAERLFERNAVVELHMSATQLQEFCDRWCADRYHHRAHEGLCGKTPMQMVAEWTQPITRIEDERALDLLLLEVPANKGVRTVQKKGIRLPEGWFIAPELEEHIGLQVHCRYLDAGRIVCYSTETWQFIGIAVEPDLAGYSRREIAAKTREIQKRRVQEARAELRAIERSVRPHDAAAEILRDDAIASGKLVVLPRRAERVSTPALDAAAEAREAIEAPRLDSSSLVSAEELALARERVERADLTLVPTPSFISSGDRAFWLADQAYSRALSAEEQSFLSDFRSSNPRISREMDELMRLRHEFDAADSA